MPEKDNSANKNTFCLFWLHLLFTEDCEYRKAFHLLKYLT